jgi:hypothetical protein
MPTFLQRLLRGDSILEAIGGRATGRPYDEPMETAQSGSTRFQNKRRKESSRKLEHVPIQSITPSPENELFYRPVVGTDPEIQALAKSIRDNGVLEPLIISADGYIISGHRRLVAARMAGLEEVPCRIDPVRRDDDLDRFMSLLREHNRQRDKTPEERLREEITSIEPNKAWAELEFQ